MYINLDYPLEREKLTKKVLVWRIIAIVTLLFLFYTLAIISGSTKRINLGQKDYIAQIDLTGEIVDGMYDLSKISQLANDPQAKAVIVQINSPGGATVQSEQIYCALRNISRRKKPVVAAIGGMGASGAYMVAVGADRIFAYHTSITGSIGVIASAVEVTELAEKIGIKPVIIKSSPLKATPNLFEKMTDESRQVLADITESIYSRFVSIVRERRLAKTTDVAVRQICNGRIYSGTQAKALNLIDEIGGEDEVREWLMKQHKIDRKIEIKRVSITVERKKNILAEFFADKVQAFLHDQLRINSSFSFLANLLNLGSTQQPLAKLS